MKLRNIFIAGLSALVFASCSDYLDVEAPSKNDQDYVFSDATEINRALNGAYAALLSNDAFGKAVQGTYTLNSDVDFVINNTDHLIGSRPSRFDVEPDYNSLAKTWSIFYKGIEQAAIIADRIPKSPLYNAEDPDIALTQAMGEAKVIRAIIYHELTWMFGDVPFSMEPSYNAEPIFPVVDRTEMLQTLIDDLKEAAEGMQYSNELADGVERISKEMAYAMIARLALTAGGYSLRPDGGTMGKMERPANYQDFYRIAMEYSKKVIESGTHKLQLPYNQVFLNECNFVRANGDDVIFELPFGLEANGTVGYLTGPQVKANEFGESNPVEPLWGETNGGAQLNAFYRFTFAEGDARRDYIAKLWTYNGQGNPELNASARTMHNGKWAKLWAPAGKFADGSGEGTGINYPYMRYTDVLLMFAEAVCELEDGFGGTNGTLAKQAVAEVRTRAFPNNAEMVDPYIASAVSKEDALEMILNERKWEFAGENMRWRDLVRNNQYNINAFYNFYRYIARAEDAGGSSDYSDAVARYDWDGNENGWDCIPNTIYYKNNVVNEGGEGFELATPENFPNQSIKVVKIANPYKRVPSTEMAGKGYDNTAYMSWFSDNDGKPETQMLYNSYGYIYMDQISGIIYIRTGPNNEDYSVAPTPNDNPTVASLPVLRYIMPYPRSVISHSNGQYTNKYGYN